MKKVLFSITLLLTVLALTVSSYLYGVDIGSEVQEANIHASEAVRLVHSVNYDSYHELPAEYREAKINEYIVLMGTFIDKRRPTPFLDEIVQANIEMFKEAADYRIQNPDLAKFDKTLIPFSKEAIARVKELSVNGELSDLILNRYIKESYYYHLARKSSRK
ncbi:hypothetical protein NBRC116592_04400 [Colwellia sp. KU-HH00111]|uniref:hypothetical protein n=1 Tax=Colwellia sp. KU-HH00111 TaxID=3127652 RepID=UPI00310525E8